jgi:PiT family inorganic phosphate transporter
MEREIDPLMDFLTLPVIAIAAIFLTWAFDFVNGFHDSANSIATIVATRVLTPVQAVTMAAVFNFMGFIVIGSAVAAMIQTGIIHQNLVSESYGLELVLSALIGAIAWNLITWWLGIPASSSHSLVGGLIGAGVAAIGLDAINWSGIAKVASFIVISPVVGFIAGFAIVAFVIRMMHKTNRTKVNRWFRRLQIVSSASYSMTHGANDAQKGMGIIMLVLVASGAAAPTDHAFMWVAITCYAALSIGTFLGGWRIVKTMASRITKLDPYQGFCAETGAAVMLLATAHMGIPVSTTHTISGSIMGVGSAKRTSAVRWGIGRRLVVAWILTIPISATISGAIFWTYLQLV